MSALEEQVALGGEHPKSPRDETTSQATDLDQSETPAATPAPSKHGWRFWLVFVSLCLVSFSSALDSTIITTALPKITSEIGGEDKYVWIANSFVLSSTSVQPLVGQLSDIFGRRWPMLISVTLFALGSGIAGGATNVAMLIAGRTVQGLGSGGLFVLVDLITCDLVPMRERGQYLGLMLSTAAIGTILGPILGGALAQANWRWVFFINLPISAVGLITMIFYLNLKHKREPTWKAALARVDYVGSAIFIGSITALLLGLIMGGNTYPWSSWHVIVPLVIGGAGWILYHFHQASSLCKEPTMPPRLFTNRTSFVGFLLAFLSAMLLEWIVYFLPVYFQAVKGASPLRSGVDILPLNVFLIPFAMVAGVLMSKTGKYRPLHWTGFGAIAIGSGLFSILGRGSSRAAWVCFQLVAAAGLGFVMTTILPSIQASLAESDAATATGTYAFMRSFGFVWGITIPSIVFNNQFDKLLHRISDSEVRSALANGGAYGFAASGQLQTLTPTVHAETVSVYSDVLHKVWDVSIAFALLGFLAVFFARDLKLRAELETEFGLEEKTERTTSAAEAEKAVGN